MDKYITLENIISARDVLQRWHKKAVFLNELAETHVISLYVLNESRVRPTDGKTVYFCSRVLNIRYNILGNDLYDIDNIFLRPEDMAAYEKAHPEILWEPAHPEEMIIKDYGQNIPADIVRQWLKMSPAQFIDLMNRGEGPISSWEEGYRKHAENLYPEAPFFSTQDLRDESFTINVYDWLDWQKARASAGKAIGEAASGLSDVAASNAGRDAALAAKGEELEQARAELAALREENAALKAELEEARQAKGRDALKWYGLIAVVEQCRNEGKTPQETAAELKKGGASFAIIGGLLHPEGDISDWLQYGKNLVEGKTKKLAW